MKKNFILVFLSVLFVAPLNASDNVLEPEKDFGLYYQPKGKYNDGYELNL